MIIHSSQYWHEHFRHNLTINRIDWSVKPLLTDGERNNIVRSLQAWQLGETSDGAHLLNAANRYAKRIRDDHYPKAVSLFIKEEQKHGNNLGKYLDLIGEKRVSKDWGDTLFRKIRYFNTSMELWTIAVITVESTAQVFYQALKEATGCKLLKQVCTDILIDEASHIEFQVERLSVIYANKSAAAKYFTYYFYKLFYFSTILVVWCAHRRLFRAGHNTFRKYARKMNLKFEKTIGKMKAGALKQPVWA